MSDIRPDDAQQGQVDILEHLKEERLRAADPQGFIKAKLEEWASSRKGTVHSGERMRKEYELRKVWNIPAPEPELPKARPSAAEENYRQALKAWERPASKRSAPGDKPKDPTYIPARADEAGTGQKKGPNVISINQKRRMYPPPVSQEQINKAAAGMMALRKRLGSKKGDREVS